MNDVVEDEASIKNEPVEEFEEGSIGCQHSDRRAKFLTPCCTKEYVCRFCHDENEDHNLDRNLVTELVCMECDKRQGVQESCVNCGVDFGEEVDEVEPVDRAFDDDNPELKEERSETPLEMPPLRRPAFAVDVRPTPCQHDYCSHTLFPIFGFFPPPRFFAQRYTPRNFHGRQVVDWMRPYPAQQFQHLPPPQCRPMPPQSCECDCGCRRPAFL